MAGTTTNFAIPYPSSTDYVTDGATAMKSLADQVDAAMFTGSSSGNLIINGAMQVTQRSAVGTAVTGLTTAGYNTADRWRTDINSLGTWSQTTNNDAPTGSGFRNSFKLACTTADASPAAGDYLVVQQKIEGQNCQAIRKGTASAQTLTLSFWVASFQTGTFIVELEDVDNSRACSKSYTVSVSNTWEYKTVTFPADITGALDNDANQSLVLNFWLGAGTTYTSGTLQTTWGTTTNANRAVGVTNLASSTSNRWNMTGAQLTVGSVATPFEFKSFGEELEQCQRYCISRKTDFTVFNGFTTTNSQKWTTAHLPTTMRASPNFTAFDGAGNSGKATTLDSAGTATNNVAISFQQSFPTLVYVLVAGTHTGFFYSYFVECEL
jgi:hypothetical protein